MNVDLLPESRLDAILPAGGALGVTEALERAKAAGHDVSVAPADGELRWAIDGMEWRAGLGPAPREALEVLVAAGQAAPELAAPGAMALSVFTHLPPSCQAAYQEQVAVVHALAPDALAVYDANAQTLMSPPVVADLATVPVPAPPSRLYSIHVVLSEGLAWLHTHGLRRCGTVEVELVDVPKERINDMKRLLEAAASRLIEEAAPPSMCTAFEVSRETKVVWIPWAKAARKLTIAGPGAHRDPAHTVGTGVLRAKPGRWRSCAPHCCIESRPRVLVSRAETRRMAAGARARWSRFARLVDAHAGDDDWSFLAKASFAAEGPCGPEHLWMAVDAVDAEGWTGRVLSDPCRASIAAGDSRRAELSALSGFQVRSPHGTFGPDELAELEAILAEGDAPTGGALSRPADRSR